MRWRSRRFTRLRVTAGPTPLPTTNPTEIEGTSVWCKCRTTDRVAARRPCRIVRRKSSPARIRAGAGNMTGRFDRAQAASFARPLRRRVARIERPARVRIRSRKPCFLLRRRLFGWYVRLLTDVLHAREDEVVTATTGSRRMRQASKAVGLPNGTASAATGSNRSVPVDNSLLPPDATVSVGRTVTSSACARASLGPSPACQIVNRMIHTCGPSCRQSDGTAQSMKWPRFEKEHA